MTLRYEIKNTLTGERYEFTADDQTQADQLLALNRNSYGDQMEVVVTDISAELVRSAVIAGIQRRLDALAQSWGYDSILSLATYRDSAVPKFAAEAAVGLAWRDAAWAYAAAAQDVAQTADQFWSNFPATPERPV